MSERAPRPSFFGAFPTHGVWTALALSRGQFVTIVAISVAAFLFIDGPLWSNLRENHFRRIIVSYVAIPMMVLVCHLRGAGFDLRRLFGATIVIGVIKLLVTAFLVLALSI